MSSCWALCITYDAHKINKPETWRSSLDFVWTEICSLGLRCSACRQPPSSLAVGEWEGFNRCSGVLPLLTFRMMRKYSSSMLRSAIFKDKTLDRQTDRRTGLHHSRTAFTARGSKSTSFFPSFLPSLSPPLISFLIPSVSIVTRLWAGRQGFDPSEGQGFFPSRHSVQTGSGAHPPSCSMGTDASSHGIKRPMREAAHSPPSNAEVGSVWNYTSTSALHLRGE
jgi:hypothetical protein